MCELDLSGTAEEFCEQRNEFLVSIKGGECINQLSNSYLIKKYYTDTYTSHSLL